MFKLALLATSIVLAGALAAAPPQAQTGAPTTPQMADMMKMHEQMMAEMKTADARLDQLVTEMNAATGETKISAMARAITELVNQQKTMHGRMGSMHGDMQMMMMRGQGMMMMPR